MGGDLGLKIYTDATGKKSQYFKDLNIGKLMSTTWRGDVADWPFFALDNGAWSAYVNKTEWKPDILLKHIERIEGMGIVPDFIVAPDIVAGGLKSLEFSLQWMGRLPQNHFYYLAVQDGMTLKDVVPHLNKFAGLFVGGSMTWKMKTSPCWCELAKDYGMGCHIGRVGTYQRMLWAERIGATSIDSTNWVQSIRSLRHLEYYKSQKTLNSPFF